MEMEALAEGLWGLADLHESNGEIGKAVKCLEAICQSHVSFLPIVEIKTRLRIATILLKHTHNVNHAKSHLERSQLLLKSIPSCFELKCRAYSLLSQCYHLVGAIPQQKQILNKGLEMMTTSGDGFAVKLWSCNFNSQLANALVIEGDYQSSLSALERGYTCATEINYPELQMFFMTSTLHVHLMQWEDVSLVEKAVENCNSVWESIQANKRQRCLGLLFYSEILHIFYRLRICDYKNAAQHVDKLDAAMKDSLQRDRHIRELTTELDSVNRNLSQSDLQHRQKSALYEKQGQLQEQLKAVAGLNLTGKEPSSFGNTRQALGDRLELAPPPVDGEWLPKSAVYALVDLMVVIFGRPKGLFKECVKRIQSGLHVVHGGYVCHSVSMALSYLWQSFMFFLMLKSYLQTYRHVFLVACVKNHTCERYELP